VHRTQRVNSNDDIDRDSERDEYAEPHSDGH
jgi:hypothetical protein